MTHATGISRRTLIGAGTALLGMGTALPASPASIALLAGTYRRLGGQGVYPVIYDHRAEAFSVGEALRAMPDASFGVRTRSGEHYLVEEQAQGKLAGWRHSDGWRRSGIVATWGADPCHLAIDVDETCLAVANYSSGSVALFRIDPNGNLAASPPIVRTNVGHGADPRRQQGPHAHWVGFSPDQRWLHSVDLGTDEILSYPFDARRGAIGEAVTGYRAPSGFGPRHMVFHPRLATAYLVGELVNRVTTLDVRDDGRFVARTTRSTLPAEHRGASQAGHIAINAAGTALYVSNRGDDSLMVHAIDRAGDPMPIQHIATGGAWPRFFLLLDEADRLICANERAGSIVAFAIGSDGRLTPTGAVGAVPGVVFLGRS